MTESTDVASATSTGVSAPVGFNRDLNGAVGLRSDPATTDASEDNSVSSLLKGGLSGLGIAAGSGQGVTDTTPRLINDPEAAIGKQEDTPVTVGGNGSMVGVLKGLLSLTGI